MAKIETIPNNEIGQCVVALQCPLADCSNLLDTYLNDDGTQVISYLCGTHNEIGVEYRSISTTSYVVLVHHVTN